MKTVQERGVDFFRSTLDSSDSPIPYHSTSFDIPDPIGVFFFNICVSF